MIERDGPLTRVSRRTRAMLPLSKKSIQPVELIWFACSGIGNASALAFQLHSCSWIGLRGCDEFSCADACPLPDESRLPLQSMIRWSILTSRTNHGRSGQNIGFKFQTTTRYASAFSRRDASEACVGFTLLEKRGRRESRAPIAPAVVRKTRTSGPQVQPDHPGFPRAMVYGLYVISPVTGLSCHRRPRSLART